MNSYVFYRDGKANPSKLHLEMVERKGIGHPDTLADAIAEETSRRYASHCVSRFGAVAHHWFDKVMLIGGEADTAFLQGRIIRPIRAILAGKAVLTVGTDAIPLLEIFEESVKNVFSSVLKNFCFEEYCKCEVQVHDSVGPGQKSFRYRPKSIRELKQFESGHLVSNDCNLCVAFAPYTAVERLVLGIEAFLLSVDQQNVRPWLGVDIKTIVTRCGSEISVLINIPMLTIYVDSLLTYQMLRQELENDLRLFCTDQMGIECCVTVNPEWVHQRPYLTSTGTCLDTGDIGAVGRGNRHSGLITPMRSMSIEGTAGKNPLDHTGKLLNVAASRIAEQLYQQLDMAGTVYIFAKKGDRLDCPSLVAIHADADSNVPVNSHVATAEIARSVLADMNGVRHAILSGTVRLF